MGYRRIKVNKVKESLSVCKETVQRIMDYDHMKDYLAHLNKINNSRIYSFKSLLGFGKYSRSMDESYSQELHTIRNHVTTIQCLEQLVVGLEDDDTVYLSGYDLMIINKYGSDV